MADTITAWGVRDGYFVDEQEGAAFRNELKYILVTQRAAFNSPVWFNIGVQGVPAQGSACFILAVDDTMDGILNWYREEGVIFKGGSGSGINLSNIRSSYENLAGRRHRQRTGVSFMRGADASAGTIKSGGKTRRAAKMVILNADHPDVEEFVWCKAREERKARALARRRLRHGPRRHRQPLDPVPERQQLGAGHRRVHAGRRRRRRLGSQGRHHRRDDPDRSKARDLMRQISEAAWECADPGMQYDTTINKWHTAPNTGRINASNPCFPAASGSTPTRA